MQQKSARPWLTYLVTAIVLAVPLYVTSVGPFAMLQQRYPALRPLNVIYDPLAPVDEATGKRFITPYNLWWMDFTAASEPE